MIMVLSMLQCPSKTLLERVSGFLGIAEHADSFQASPETSNPCLQSFESVFKSIVKQVGVNLSCVYRCMSECLLNDEDIRGTSIQSGCKAVPKAVWCYPLINSSFDYPLIEAALDLSGRYAILQLTEEKSLGFGEHLLSRLQIAMKNRAQFGVEKAIDNLSTFSFDSDLLLQQVDIGDIQIYQLGQPDAGMQEETDDHQVPVCLPSLVMPDGLQEDTFLILGQEDRRFSVLVFDLDTNSWIMINLTSVIQPPEEAFNRSSGAINGGCHFRLPIGLLLNRIAKQEAIDISGYDFADVKITSELVKQQIQISLLGSNRMRRPAIGKLVIQKVQYCLFDCQIILLSLFMESHVQQCHVKPRKSRQKKEINVTVRW
jgi:hypothetical protein